MNQNNPAARLHRILSLAKAQNERVKSLDAWKEILDIESEEPLEIMTSVWRVFSLPKAVERAVLRHPHLDTALYLGWKNEVTKAFRSLKWDQFNSFSQHISDSLLVSLAFIAETLGREAPETVFEDSEFQKLRDEAWKLFEELDASSLEEPFRQFLLDRLAIMLQAMDDYPVFGSRPLQTAMEASVGAAIFQSDVAKRASESELGKRFWVIIGRVATALSLLHTGLEIAQSTATLLTRLQAPSVEAVSVQPEANSKPNETGVQ